jgi:hypothetical protein
MKGLSAAKEELERLHDARILAHAENARISKLPLKTAGGGKGKKAHQLCDYSH